MTARITKRAGELDPLVQVITDKLAAQDNASRLQRATALAASLFPDNFSAEGIGSPTTKAPDLQADLGQDPGEKAVGVLGVFWDDDDSPVGCSDPSICDAYEGGRSPYSATSGGHWRHFRHIPTNPEALQFLKDNSQ